MIKHNFTILISTILTIIIGISLLLVTKEATVFIEKNWIIVGFIAIVLVIIIFQLFILQVKVDIIKRKERKTAALIQDVTCYNQGSFIDYNTIASELHKALKAHLFRETPNEEALAKAFDELNNYANTNLNIILKENIRLLEKYFTYHKDLQYLPRICVRVLQNNKLVTLATNNVLSTEKAESIDEDTGIKYAAEHGKYFLCNNIPQAAAKGEYHNSRLNNEKATSFDSNFFSILNKKRTDEKWCNCWEDEHCFKSALIIPMTLMNNTMSDLFRRHFQIKDIGRSIWGYICIDHTEIDYFDDSMDISIGHIFANILSLYLVTTHFFTEGSMSYQKTKNILDIPGEKFLNIVSLDLFSPTNKFSGRKKPSR